MEIVVKERRSASRINESDHFGKGGREWWMYSRVVTMIVAEMRVVYVAARYWEDDEDEEVGCVLMLKAVFN